MKRFLPICFFACWLVTLPIQAASQKITDAPASATTENNSKSYIMDSIYSYNSSGNVNGKEFIFYNANNLKVCSYQTSIDWNGNEYRTSMDSIYYDANQNILKEVYLKWQPKEWIAESYKEYARDENGKVQRTRSYRFNIYLEKWILDSQEDYTYDAEGNMIERLSSHTNDDNELIPSSKTIYSDFIELDKPEKGTSYSYYNNQFSPSTNIYNEYDEQKRLISTTSKFIEESGERNSSRNDWVYNGKGQLIEVISYTTTYPEYDFYANNKTLKSYDSETDCLALDSTFWYSAYNETWNFSGENKYYWSKGAETFARVGSYWNYWFGSEYSYGFHNYKVVKDTTITAPFFETGEIYEVTASWIEKRTSSTMYMGGSGSNDVYQGGFAMYRQGNTSYVWEPRNKMWFKWIDMNAKPGDKWVVPELVSGLGLYDYVEVSFLDTLHVDGQDIPYLYLIPSCTSRYTNKKDFTSRLSMAGYVNIDYWNLYDSAEPRANGYIYPNYEAPGRVEGSFGLICATVNGVDLATDNLKEYVMDNNPSYYEQGIIDCDSLKAPIRAGGGPGPMMSRPLTSHDSQKGIHFTIYNLSDDRIVADKAAKAPAKAQQNTPGIEITPTDTLTIPVVMHVVYNPENMEGKIELRQAQRMIEELNNAYTTTHIDEVRNAFKSVVGNPYIRFVLADKDPEGNATDGMVYYETDKDYFDLPSIPVPQYRYAFKFNSDGSARNWDHTNYSNIYVVDLGGFSGEKNIGGFVTNPEYETAEEFEIFKKWSLEGDPEFWINWLASEEGSQLDGLTVDTWYTFGGKSEKNPNATFKTAIHELGHYLGLKHPSVQILEDNDGNFIIHDDGFEDTPFTHYNQYSLIPCGRDIYQCGNLVQTENYMDYSLECACMFTLEQSAFMRNFAVTVRPDLIRLPEPGPDQTADINTERAHVYPNPAKDIIYIKGSFIEGEVLDVAGRVVKNISSNEESLMVTDFNAGLYFIKLKLANNTTETYKIMVNR